MAIDSGDGIDSANEDVEHRLATREGELAERPTRTTRERRLRLTIGRAQPD